MRAPEDVLPRPVKQALLVVMVLMVFVLLLANETGSGNTAFLYVGF